MIHFIVETLSLFPFLFATYLVLEAVEAKAGGALERFLGRSRQVGPLAGALAGAIPQCGVSAAAASFYAAGAVSLGTLAAVFLSTSDELVPVLISRQAPVQLMVKIVLIKIAAAAVTGFAIDLSARFLGRAERKVSVETLCRHSRCGCSSRKGIVVPALIHAAEIFVFIVAVSAAIEAAMHFFGARSLESLKLTTPFLGEMTAGLIGLVPNCAVSVAGAQLYCSGAISGGALMSLSFTGSGLGMLVLFRTNRSIKENLSALAIVYAVGTVAGALFGRFL